jgi:hypothetical protein
VRAGASTVPGSGGTSPKGLILPAQLNVEVDPRRRYPHGAPRGRLEPSQAS